MQNEKTMAGLEKRMCDVVGDTVKLSVTTEDGEVIEIDLPVHKPTMGPPVIDVSR